MNSEREESFVYYPKMSVLSSAYGDVENDKQITRQYLLNRSKSGSDAFDELLEERFEHETRVCKLQRLSSVMSSAGIDRIDLLKIDVEKSELDVLNGIDDDDWPKIAQILIEVEDAGGRLQDICRLLERRGFVLSIRQEADLIGTRLYDIFGTRDRGDTKQRPPSWTFERVTAHRPVFSHEILRRHLAAALPEHMVPVAYVRLEALPLTPNGKLDRKGLPAPDETAYATPAFEPPQGDVEEAVARIWAEVLGLERVGRHDNFFDLGGHSLLAMRVSSRIRKEMGAGTMLMELLADPQLAEFARQVGVYLAFARTASEAKADAQGGVI